MKIYVNVVGQEAQLVDLKIESYSVARRWRRACAVFAVLAGGAVVSVLIPVLHFVLVPGLLISAFVMFYLRFQEVTVVHLDGLGCPSCRQAVTDKRLFLKADEWRSRLHCYGCGQDIEVLLKS